MFGSLKTNGLKPTKIGHKTENILFLRCIPLDRAGRARPVERHHWSYCLAPALRLDRASYTRWVEQPSNPPNLRALPSLRHPRSSSLITSLSDPNLSTPYPMAHSITLSSVQYMAWVTRCSKSSSIRWELALDSTESFKSYCYGKDTSKINSI